MQHKTAIIIAGPTAVGKTELAIRLARHFDTEIISADARQCYRELTIGVARPSPEELSAAPHHFIASHSITDTVNAAIFERYALQEAERIFATRNQVILCGGTGLYLRAFCEGLDDIPPVPEWVRSEVASLFAEAGIKALQTAISREDPVFAADGEMDNPARLLRALAVVRATGRSIREFQHQRPFQRPFRIVKWCINRPRAELYERINQRVGVMMAQGLLPEAERLRAYQHLPALQTVGYRELFAYMAGEGTLEQAIDLIRQHTRNYAKRQLTWFKKETGMEVSHPGRYEDILRHLDENT